MNKSIILAAAASLTLFSCAKKEIAADRTVLELEDDVAHVKWGGSWRMPNQVECYELRYNCTWTWTEVGGVYGRLVTSNKVGYTDKSIFLPVAGYRSGTSLLQEGTIGVYMSSTLTAGYSQNANNVGFSSGDYFIGADPRNLGFTVRPVTE